MVEIVADPTAEVTPPKQRGRFSKLSIAELQAEYLRIIGRETGSVDRGYLIWKLREAEAGRIRIGPRKPRGVGEVTIVPFRVAVAASEAMDEVWRSHGVKSRNRFLRDAICHYLTHLESPEAAAHFAHTNPAAAS